MDELIRDRHRFRQEISEQLAGRVKNYLIGQKRQKSDFVKPRAAEDLSYQNQLASNDIALDELEQETAKVDE